MKRILQANIKESFMAVIPITIIVLVLSFILVPVEVGPMMLFLAGAIMLVAGMGLFQLGTEAAMRPFGEGIGVKLSKFRFRWLIFVVSALFGILITVAEPDLQVLSNQVPAIPNAVIIWTVGIGVGIFLAVAVMRIIFKISLSGILMALYSFLIVLSFFVPRDFIAVAFDSGGVTTGPVTVPFIMAFGVGISLVRGDKNASSDSFGLVALSSVGPILAVLVLGLFYRTESSSYASSAIAEVVTMKDVINEFAHYIPHYAKDVLLSILPLVVIFAFFQLKTKRYHHREMLRIIVGFVYTYVGLVLFLCGVNVGFAPVGSLIGTRIAQSAVKWVLIPVGMLIGYFIVKAEPAIQILNRQVQNVTGGAISASAMNKCLSIGVSLSVGLAMLRVITGIPLIMIIIPGYIIALVLSRLVSPIFVGIAFDSGGVASGPMTSCFLLPLCIGACTGMGGNVMTDAFGVVALVALTPIIAIQIMGVAYKIKLKRLEKHGPSTRVRRDSDDIIEIREEDII